MLHQMNTGSYVEPNKLTVCHYLDRWLLHTQTKVSAKTFERYDEIVRQHLMPALLATICSTGCSRYTSRRTI